jgi:hypothetical protein
LASTRNSQMGVVDASRAPVVTDQRQGCVEDFTACAVILSRSREARTADLIQRDACGKLWRCHLDDEIYTMAEVENGTPEPDGSRRRYFLRVPPTARTPREAIAWTYGLTADQYEIIVRT